VPPSPIRGRPLKAPGLLSLFPLFSLSTTPPACPDCSPERRQPRRLHMPATAISARIPPSRCRHPTRHLKPHVVHVSARPEDAGNLPPSPSPGRAGRLPHGGDHVIATSAPRQRQLRATSLPSQRHLSSPSLSFYFFPNLPFNPSHPCYEDLMANRADPREGVPMNHIAPHHCLYIK
jgi:hypothetical protein